MPGVEQGIQTQPGSREGSGLLPKEAKDEGQMASPIPKATPISRCPPTNGSRTPPPSKRLQVIMICGQRRLTYGSSAM